MGSQCKYAIYKTNDLLSSNFVALIPLGFEFGYTNLVFVRAVGNFKTSNNWTTPKSGSFQPNIGLGFKYKGIQIDYALTDLGNQSAALYSISFR
jgi:hypothetical protein